ncbi:hypothetical protein [Blautia sp. MSJ-19]|uniref:hypothetical protein n=1 Tax=Blautia sp. MSJ-19 TaxID=2841517 RepID=UPI00209DFB07|nr:hypothetical protein [Blautia sp. MSJ-19]
MKRKQITAIISAVTMLMGTTVYGVGNVSAAQVSETDQSTIESTLNMANNDEITWSYDSQSDSWTMSVTSAVANPELPDYQGVSVNVPGAYVKGIDTDGDGTEDVTGETYSEEVKGQLVIDDTAEITNANGQTYTASTAPVIINTGAAGYSAQENQKASSSNAAYGYINVACGNRGKQSTATDEDGEEYYTGDAPLCLVDQKNAIRFVKYNIILGNLPGNTEYFVSTGGSGGGAHAAMVAATSDNSDYFPYEAEAGAVGIYQNEDRSYSEALESVDAEISDGVWGCVAYSAITSLQEADMAMAFEYYLDTDYEFNTDFQKKMAEYLSEEYMDYINAQNLSISESAVNIDINEDGDKDDVVDLTIEYDEEKYADTNGYGGTYLTLYLKEFEKNLEWYLENLDYADDWTWFDSDGNALSDESVAQMTTEEKAQAFLEGRYAKGESGQNAGPGGGMPDGNGPAGEKPEGAPDGNGPDGEKPDGAPDGNGPDGDMPDGKTPDENKQEDELVTSGMGDEVGTPDAGTTQSADSKTDSVDYSSYEEMLESYESDIASIEDGDKYGNNIVDLYNPLNYIGDEDTESPTWTRIVMGASEGDMSLFASMNMQIAWLNSGTDAELEWQWDGGHVPSEIFGESLALYVDEMYGKYVEGAAEVTKAEAQTQTQNGTATEATGTDISSWASYEDGEVKFTLADAASYRTKGASKATPGFDVIDYGQETYEFGSTTQDARHFDKYVLKVLQEEKETLEELFNSAQEQ